jgi:hypothetical protein
MKNAASYAGLWTLWHAMGCRFGALGRTRPGDSRLGGGRSIHLSYQGVLV